MRCEYGITGDRWRLRVLLGDDDLVDESFADRDRLYTRAEEIRQQLLARHLRDIRRHEKDPEAPIWEPGKGAI